MNEAEIERVALTQDRLAFELKDGRMISVPLSFYPTLLRATPAERKNFELYLTSVHWPTLDCDIGGGRNVGGCEEIAALRETFEEGANVRGFSGRGVARSAARRH